MESMVKANFWRGKKVLVTGHTGFKGGWLCLWLTSMGAEVSGLALAPPTRDNFFDKTRLATVMTSRLGDIRTYEVCHAALDQGRPDIVFHLAAQPLVRASYQQPLNTYATNVMGTAHVLEAVRVVGGVKAVVNVTSDKCYDSRDSERAYREDDPLGGFDPYSSSKACAELVTATYRQAFLSAAGVALASARAGNVIGGGDWASDRLVPDLIRACIGQQPVWLRNPEAIRPWQHVLEPLAGYLMLAQALYEQPSAYAEAWNFGPADVDAKPVHWLATYLWQRWSNTAAIRVDQGLQPVEAPRLTLDCRKAKAKLGWLPRWSLATALDATIAWHQAEQAGGDMRAFSLQQIADYMAT